MADTKKPKKLNLKSEETKSTQKTSIADIITKYNMILIVAEVAVILGLGYLFLIQPQLLTLQDNQAEGVAYWEDKLSTAQAKFTSTQELVNAYNQLNTSQRQRLNHILPRTDEAIIFMSQLEQLFLSQELLVGSISISPEEVQGADYNIVNVGFGVVIDPGYENFKRLLTTIEDHIRIMNINSISYVPGSTAYTFEAQVFFLK